MGELRFAPIDHRRYGGSVRQLVIALIGHERLAWLRERGLYGERHFRAGHYQAGRLWNYDPDRLIGQVLLYDDGRVAIHDESGTELSDAATRLGWFDGQT